MFVSNDMKLGVVWLLLVCVVRCWVKFCNECNLKELMGVCISGGVCGLI